MGEVWKASHTVGERRHAVAVKLITARLAMDDLYRAAFRAEVRAVADLDHPHVLRVFDHGLVSLEAARISDGLLVAGSPWLAMELVEPKSSL